MTVPRVDVLAFGFIGLLAACGGASSSAATAPPCTEIGCRSAIAVVTGHIELPTVPLGMHRFDIEADGVAQTCTVDYTANTSSVFATCTGGAELSFGPATRNVEDRSMPGVVGVRFEVIPGAYTWQLTLGESPAAVKVTHRFGDHEIARREATLTYADVRPNGPACEPVCRQAEATWDFSP